MWLSDTSVKRPRPVAALVLSLLGCVFAVVSFGKRESGSNVKENN
jgi:hypothetical protein